MICDALAHVTPDGRWFTSAHRASENDLLADLDGAAVDSSIVCGLPAYIDNEFVLSVSRRHPDRLYPVGSFDPTAWRPERTIKSEARAQLRDRGFVGFKLHPRLGSYDLLDAPARHLLDEVGSWSAPPVVWVCTFLHHGLGGLRKGPVETLHELVVSYPTIRFVLAHAGGPDLLRLATAVRACPNAMLDLSYTLVRFAGSSIDADIRFLIGTFENRLLFGSDFPEIRVTDARRRIDHHLVGAKPGAASRVLGENLRGFALLPQPRQSGILA